MKTETLFELPHRRRNLLNGEWVLVSPQRTERPWQGEVSMGQTVTRPAYDPGCYLCPGNLRANGERNPAYPSTYVFCNDFPALLPQTSSGRERQHPLLQARSEPGLCRVVNFSPRHDLTLAEMAIPEIEKVVAVWCDEFATLSTRPGIRHIQIFENKGAMMGNSNPHPHGQIWAQAHVPMEVVKEQRRFSAHFRKTGRSLLEDYLDLELKLGERLVWSNASFVALVPFWALWPFETLLMPRRRVATLLSLSAAEKKDFAAALKAVTARYDTLFGCSFPYSAGIHQAPCDGRPHPEWHLHMHFYPPLLRSATIRKFMVGYELLAEPQRDISPESAAARLRDVKSIL